MARTSDQIRRSCNYLVKGEAGYCLCEGGITVARVDCGMHRFRCSDKCAELAYDQSSALPLPKPLTCARHAPAAAGPRANATARPAAAAEPAPDVIIPRISRQLALALPEMDTEELSRRANKVWDTVDDAVMRNSVDDVKMPPVRDHKRDWVMEHQSLSKQLVAHLREAVAHFKQDIPPYPGEAAFSGRGIVMVGGGVRYIVPAWASLMALRLTGCTLPVELWFPVEEFPSLELEAALGRIGVTCRRLDQRDLGQHGYVMKVAALMLSRFKEVLFLDADNAPLRDPTFLFDVPEYQRTGAILWQDYWSRTSAPEVSTILNISQQAVPPGSFESGQMLIDKSRHWAGLAVAVFLNTNAAVFYELLTCYLGKGDKDTFAYAMLSAGEEVFVNPVPAGSAGYIRPLCKRLTRKCRSEFLGNTMVQHAPNGTVVFFHANYGKWNFELPHEWADYVRRWQVVQPLGVTHEQLAADLGYDLEHEVYDALVRFRCAPWFDAYLRSRQHMGDKAAAKLPRLAGFHPLSDYLRFQPFFRKGWRGTFTDNLFVPSVWDTIVNWYFRVFRWPVRPYERALKRKLKALVGM